MQKSVRLAGASHPVRYDRVILCVFVCWNWSDAMARHVGDHATNFNLKVRLALTKQILFERPTEKTNGFFIPIIYNTQTNKNEKLFNMFDDAPSTSDKLHDCITVSDGVVSEKAVYDINGINYHIYCTRQLCVCVCVLWPISARILFGHYSPCIDHLCN